MKLVFAFLMMLTTVVKIHCPVDCMEKEAAQALLQLNRYECIQSIQYPHLAYAVRRAQMMPDLLFGG